MNNPAITNDSWKGVLTLAPMVSLFTGAGGETTEHLHPAQKVVLGARTVTYGGSKYSADAIAIPTGVPHSISARGRSVVIAFLDARRFGFEDVKGLTAQFSRVDITSNIADSLLGGLRALPARALDSRMTEVLETLSNMGTIAQAAEQVHLSQSRVAHLITEQLGSSPGTFRAWIRFRLAIDEVALGRTVTDAAHAAGFADASHFSRSCRSILGIAPSALAAGRLQVVHDS